MPSTEVNPIADWRDIATLDKSQMQFVQVAQDGAVRLHLWNPRRQAWERPYPVGSIVAYGDDCYEPTHWMPCPNAPGQANAAPALNPLDSGVWFQSECSGLWYQNPMTAGSFSLMRINGRTMAVSGGDSVTMTDVLPVSGDA